MSLIFTDNGHTTICKGLNGELVLLNDCICPGYEVTYECTVCGVGATLWTGSLCDCIILLEHETLSEFRGNNNGSVTVAVHSIGDFVINGSHCFSSQLNVRNISSEMNNKTVTCFHVDGNSVTVGETLGINITTGSLIIILL